MTPHGEPWISLVESGLGGQNEWAGPQDYDKDTVIHS